MKGTEYEFFAPLPHFGRNAVSAHFQFKKENKL